MIINKSNKTIRSYSGEASHIKIVRGNYICAVKKFNKGSVDKSLEQYASVNAKVQLFTDIGLCGPGDTYVSDVVGLRAVLISAKNMVDRGEIDPARFVSILEDVSVVEVSPAFLKFVGLGEHIETVKDIISRE